MANQLIKTLFHSIVLLLSINISILNASIIPNISIPDEEIIELLESGPSWIPKPYKTPIEQGTLLDQENLNKVVPGLSKEQVKFLLGTPTIIDIFHTDRWITSSMKEPILVSQILRE